MFYGILNVACISFLDSPSTLTLGVHVVGCGKCRLLGTLETVLFGVQVPEFSEEATQVLETLCGDQFTVDTANRVKTVERTTNHDVKAVEYVLRETMELNQELKKVRSCLFITTGSLIDREIVKC